MSCGNVSRTFDGRFAFPRSWTAMMGSVEASQSWITRGAAFASSPFGVAIGEHVTVELLSGHRFPVEVIWAISTQIGVRFLGPIQPGHPALMALEKAANKYKRAHRQTKVT
jgi:hypothetical protein